MAQDLSRLGASLPEIQNAGRWKDPRMPASYIGVNCNRGETVMMKYSKYL